MSLYSKIRQSNSFFHIYIIMKWSILLFLAVGNQAEGRRKLTIQYVPCFQGWNNDIGLHQFWVSYKEFIWYYWKRNKIRIELRKSKTRAKFCLWKYETQTSIFYLRQDFLLVRYFSFDTSFLSELIFELYQ